MTSQKERYPSSAPNGHFLYNNTMISDQLFIECAMILMCQNQH